MRRLEKALFAACCNRSTSGAAPVRKAGESLIFTDSGTEFEGA
jgi:hypothetical protein